MLVHCTNCAAALPLWVIKARDTAMCPTCEKDMLIRVFPALLVRPSVVDPNALRLEEGEASCFYHSSKRASTACDKCGRFVCALCSVEFDGANWCPACLQTASARGRNTKLENRRVLYDSIALAIATWPFIFIWTSFVGGPVAVYYSIRYWKRPTSLIPRYKWRFIVAIVCGLSELVLVGILIFALIKAPSVRPVK